MTEEKYILDANGDPQPEPDSMKWAEWFEHHRDEKRVAVDYFGEVMVSTVFLGLDHNFLSEGDPILYEPMIFGGEHDQYQDRYRTKVEALEGHKRAVELVQGLKS